MIREAHTFCRICQGMCGMVATIEDGRVVKVRGDRDNAMTRGFACSKGLASPEFHNGPRRLLHHQRRRVDGTHEPIGFDDALDLVAERLRPIIDTHGPGAVAAYIGTQATCNAVYRPLAIDFMRALGSPSLFSSMTIDQSAKWVTVGRMGSYLAGRQPLAGADVWLLCGVNPMVSMSGWSGGLPPYDPVKQIKEARRGGLKLIVIDPVRTQTAENADLFLQPLPGHDAAIFAALIRIVLAEGWHDREFCAAYADGLDALAAAVAPFDERMVTARAGLSPGQLRAVAEMFARDGRRGCAGGGTGPNMASHSNLAEHLIEALNVICGRYNRAGEPVPYLPVLQPTRTVRAEVRPPRRTWEAGHKGTTGIGTMFGEMMTATLADDILHDGPGGLRALFCIGSNPANALPDQRKAVSALRSLDLLVTSDVVWSDTARLADAVFAVKQPFERPDHTQFLEGLGLELPFAQYTPALVDPPAGSDVVDDWLVYYRLAQRLGLQLALGERLDMAVTPTSDGLLNQLASGATIPYEVVKAAPSGAVFDRKPPLIAPPRLGRDARLALAPADIVADMAALQADDDRRTVRGCFATHLLTSRRERETMNSFGRDLTTTRRRFAANPAWMNPADVTELGVQEGASVRIMAEEDEIITEVRSDPSVRRGIISMSHGWGSLSNDPGCKTIGASTARLVTTSQAVQPINAMPVMSGIPVLITVP